METDRDVTVPRGASDAVRQAAVEMVRQHGPDVLLETAKCHFKTTDAVLAEAGFDRKALGPEGQVESKPYQRRHKNKR
jgi:hypothetical protein